MSSPKISLLEDIAHIRLRPGMYIGNTYRPDHLLQEVVDNSLDEALNGYANEITINFQDNAHVIVTDNGRGIPVHEVMVPGIGTENSVIVACTMLKSGSKFDNNAYNMSLGMHGIGLVAVNALSSSMRVSVKDQINRKLIHDFQFVDSHLVDYQQIEYETTWSTRVEFIANPKFFTIGSFDQSKFEDRLKLVHTDLKEANFIINDKKIEYETLEEFTKEFFGLNPDSKLFKLTLDEKQIKLNAFITYDLAGNSASELRGDVNFRTCAGTYLTNFTTAFINAITTEYGDKLSRTEILSHFRGYVHLFLQNPDFDSQSKTNMIKSIAPHLQSMRLQFENVAKSQYVKDIIQSIIDQKTLKKAAKKVTKKSRVSSTNPLKDCLKIPGEILYIMEGESADGTLDRDKKTEAVLPISGKILNVVNSTVDKVVESKKFKFLLEALGVSIGKKNQTDFRYNRVRILCDADPDEI